MAIKRLNGDKPAKAACTMALAAVIAAKAMVKYLDHF